jgi:hypothetical protein
MRVREQPLSRQATSNYRMGRSRVRVFAGYRGDAPNTARITPGRRRANHARPPAGKNGLRPLSQACPSGGKLGKIDSSKMGFGVSVVSFCGSVDSNSSRANLIRSYSIGVTPARRFELYRHSSVRRAALRAVTGRRAKYSRPRGAEFSKEIIRANIGNVLWSSARWGGGRSGASWKSSRLTKELYHVCLATRLKT